MLAWGSWDVGILELTQGTGFQVLGVSIFRGFRMAAIGLLTLCFRQGCKNDDECRIDFILGACVSDTLKPSYSWEDSRKCL